MKLIALIFLFLAMAFLHEASATSVTDCMTLENDTYDLTGDVSTESANCFAIGNNTVLDGHGYTIYANCTAFSNLQEPAVNISIHDMAIVFNESCIGFTSAAFFGSDITNYSIENVTISYAPDAASGSAMGFRFGLDGPGESEAVSYLSIRNVTANMTGDGAEIYHTDNLIISDSSFIVQSTAASANFLVLGGTAGLATNMTLDNVNASGWLGTGAGIIFVNVSNGTFTDMSAVRIMAGGSSAHNLVAVGAGNNNLTFDGLNIDCGNNTAGVGFNTNQGDNSVINDFEIGYCARGISTGQTTFYSLNYSYTNGHIHDINTTSASSGLGILAINMNASLFANITINNTRTSAFSFAGFSGRTSGSSIADNVSVSYSGTLGTSGGCFLFFGTDNDTLTNSQCHTSRFGLFMGQASGSTNVDSNNLVYNNIFDPGHGSPPYFNYVNFISTSSFGNRFNSSAIGNNWSDYAGWDLTGDGIGDIAYQLNSSVVTYYDYLPITTNIDLYAPSVTIASPANASYATASIALNYTASDNQSGIESCWYDAGAGNITLGSCGNSTLNVSEGQNSVIVYANDTAGWEGSATVWFTVDIPEEENFTVELAINSPDAGSQPVRTVVFDVTAIPGANSCLVERPGTANQTMGNASSQDWSASVSLPEGTTLFRVWCFNGTAYDMESLELSFISSGGGGGTIPPAGLFTVQIPNTMLIGESGSIATSSALIGNIGTVRHSIAMSFSGVGCIPLGNASVTLDPGQSGQLVMSCTVPEGTDVGQATFTSSIGSSISVPLTVTSGSLFWSSFNAALERIGSGDVSGLFMAIPASPAFSFTLLHLLVGLLMLGGMIWLLR